MSKESGGVHNVAELRTAFWRESPSERRERLLPFLWGTVSKQGQIFGDPTQRAAARVTNGKKFSYPGYNEMFVGFADERINSNDKTPNPNVNVLEFLQRRPTFAGRVSAFATWDVMDFILNRDRSGLFVRSAWVPVRDEPLTARQQQVNDLVREMPRQWRDNEYDFLTYQAAREHLIRHKPRVLYIGLGETDEWAHARRYDLYLEAAQRADRYLQELWETLQEMPEYKDRTALVITTDHGRGETAQNWTNHNKDTEGAEYIWIALYGAGVPALGIRKDVEVTQSQIAATLASLVGEDFRQSSPESAPPLPLNETKR